MPGFTSTLCASCPQHITTHRQASAPPSATTLPSHPPRPLKCPNPGPSASSPLTSPSPRPSVRKAKAALAVSLCEHSCLLPCLWASVRLPGPPRAAPARTPPTCPHSEGGGRGGLHPRKTHSLPCSPESPLLPEVGAPWRLDHPWRSPLWLSVLLQCFHLLTCHRARHLSPPVLFCASMGLEPQPCLEAFTSGPGRERSNFHVAQAQHLDD